MRAEFTDLSAIRNSELLSEHGVGSHIAEKLGINANRFLVNVRRYNRVRSQYVPALEPILDAVKNITEREKEAVALLDTYGFQAYVAKHINMKRQVVGQWKCTKSIPHERIDLVFDLHKEFTNS